ncbi:MAG TPA: hypothetical protein VKD70_12170 [Candidatus Acidoferrum sp.]|nr:hypothetical protein [Candidatus Acidoferrum sp.]
MNNSLQLASSARHHGISDFLIEGIYGFILVITIAGWTIIGFFVWVPLLIRTTALFAATVLYVTLFRDPDRMVKTEQALRNAVRFYLHGFEHFIRFYRLRHAAEPPVGPLSDLKWKELMVECIWVIGMWAVIYFSVHSVFPHH